MPHSPATRSSLVLRLQSADDQQAWAEFVALYEPLLLRMMQRYGLQEGDARDVSQDVLQAVSQDVDRWRPDGRKASFRRWLFRIARNRVLKFFEREKKRWLAAGGTTAQQKLHQHPDPHGSLAEDFQREYRRQLLLRAAGKVRREFRETTWSAFWRTCVEGRPIAEVAAELTTTTGNVYVARSRVIARLRVAVTELSEANDGCEP